MILYRWESCKPIAYDSLISRFWVSNIDERTEWEEKMGIHSGSITPALSQWLSRFLARHRFFIHKESISNLSAKVQLFRQVLDKAAELDIILEGIPPGCASSSPDL